MKAFHFWLLTCFASITYGLVMDSTLDRIVAPIYWVAFSLLMVKWLEVKT